VPRHEFERLVSTAIEGLPEDFLEKPENVQIVVEDSPTPEDLDHRRLPPGHLLLGLYRGVPLTDRSVFAPFAYPDQITIFQRSVERIAHTPQEVVEEVRRTVLHEIAHHFGISDARLRELGY
jgi:predicted Zn-dependent protease with MMP-like domain